MRHPTPQVMAVTGARIGALPSTAPKRAPGLGAPILVLTPQGEIELGEGVAIVGRLPDCAVPLLDDLVSRMHARIRVSSDSVSIEDLASTNGVYVNGLRIAKGPEPLCDGDRLLVGTTELSVFAVRNSPYPSGIYRADRSR